MLSACLLDGTRAALDQARGILRDQDFYADANLRTWQAIVDLDDSGKAPDVVLVAQRLRETGAFDRVGGSPYLAQLADATPAVAHVAQHAQIVADKGRQRRMIAELQLRLGEAYLEHEDIAKWAQDAARAIDDVAVTAPRDPPELLSELIPRVLSETESRSRHGVVVAGVDTGWSDFTRALGGWARGKTHIVAARPGMGKTAFALGAALNVAAQNLGALFFSAEMTKKELGQRSIAIWSGINGRSIQTGRLTAAEWSAIHVATSVLVRLPLSIVHKPGGRILDIRSAIRSERNGFRSRGIADLGLVVVDYLGLLDAEHQRGESREAEVARLSRELMWLAGEFDVPILVVSQLSRALETRPNKRPTLSDLRDSGAIEQDAHSVTFLYRDEYYNKASSSAGTVEVDIAKLRDGEPTMVRMAYVAECTRIANLTEQSELQYEWA